MIDLLLQMLAAKRLTQLVVEDEITRPLREPVLQWPCLLYTSPSPRD